MNLKEIERVVARIQSQLFKNSNSYAVGMLKSHFKGAGIQFKEHQLYNPGDDVRFIDWKLSAKTTNTFVKTFEEERNIEITVVLDITQSMFMGYNDVSKLQASLEVASLLFLLAEQTKDIVKVIIFCEEVVSLPGSTGHAGIAQLIAVLEKMDVVNSQGKINILKQVNGQVSEKKKLNTIKSYVARGKEVVYLTDFNQITEYETINKLIYRRNMHCFRVTCPLDDATTKPYTVYAKGDITSRFIKTKSYKVKDMLDKGRWKNLSVKERYLESFVREML
jgi:uncharacterized protein (DUF58 family)